MEAAKKRFPRGRGKALVAGLPKKSFIVASLKKIAGICNPRVIRFAMAAKVTSLLGLEGKFDHDM